MEKKFRKYLKKSLVTSLVLVVMILSTIIPVWAQELSSPDFSPWAIWTLHEGERYGIFPTSWYFSHFRAGITEERLNSLLEATGEKIAALGLDKKEGFVPLPYKGDRSRGDVLTRLYNILAQYEIPVGESPIQYMQEQKIIQGTGRGLELDRTCTTEEAVVFAIRLIQSLCDNLQASSKGFAWKLEHNNNTIYFLGSIHIGTSDLYPIDKKLREAFQEADALIVEANLLDQEDGIEYFLDKARYQDGSTLKDNVSEETYEKLLKVFEIYGIPEEAYNQFKPWSVANDLTVLSSSRSENLQEAAEAATLGIDIYFITTATLLDKPIGELEGIRYQADLLDGMSAEFQEIYLNAVLDSILEPQADEVVDSAELLEEWLDQWRKGDVEGFANSYTTTGKESENEMTSILFGQRDKDMADKIIEILEGEEGKSYFVVVGAGHFVGDNSLFYHLEERGYKLERLEY